MSIPPYSAGRGCSANFALPVTEGNVLEAQRLVETVDRVNRFVRNPPLCEIVYRGDDYEFDVRRPVYRWNTRPYQEVFANGFRAPPQGNTPNSTYYDLQDYVQNAGAPLDANRPIPRAFVSTTLSNTWTPTPSLQTLPQGGQIQLYRYEIYAPGGIWVRVTLGNQYDQYSSQAEVTFVGGIAPQYIRSAQIYTATRTPGSRFVRMNREERLILNGHFRPSLDVHFIIIVPLSYYLDDDRVRRFLPVETFTPGAGVGLKKREVLSHGFQDDDELEWYRHGVEDIPIYINAAFRSSRKNEAYIFMNDEYALMNYAPGTKNDRIVNGPLLICDGFPSLIGTPFGEHGIDCAFDTDKNEAYIFSGNLCAYIDYAPGTTDDKILSGPMSIRDMFPCLKGTVCETGIDTAFRSSKSKKKPTYSVVASMLF